MLPNTPLAQVPLLTDGVGDREAKEAGAGLLILGRRQVHARKAPPQLGLVRTPSDVQSLHDCRNGGGGEVCRPSHTARKLQQLAAMQE